MTQPSKLKNGCCLVALDMDNTILEGRFIDTAAEFLGHTASLIGIRKNILDPMLRTQKIAELLQGVELETLRKIVESIPMVSDAKAVIASLKDDGCIVGIVSDSYDCVTDHLKQILGLDFALANHLETEGSRATGKVVVPEYFQTGNKPLCEHVICKSHAIQYLSELYGVDLDHMAAVGDSENDICMVKYAGVGIAFCTEDNLLLDAADHVITTRSFRDLLKFITTEERMKNTDIVEKWPGNIQDTKGLHMMSFNEWDEKYMTYNGIVVVTDGWKEGTAACVLRGGVNAVAVLELLSMSGFKRVKIYHLEEKLAQLEDVFTSTVMEYANAHFDNVNVVWRNEPTLDHLLKKIGEEHSMLLFGAPLTPSELPKFHERVKKCFTGSVTLVRGPLVDIEIDKHDKMLKWVKERTYEASDFSMPGLLKSYKKQRGTKVAVILPALNEEETVGNVIKMALEVKNAGIIDEIILIDSDSADKTVAIAETYGIPVFRHSEIRKDLGTYNGKGEAMFKSLYATDADIIAWVDTDISTITPEFFYGLLGPLLSNPDIRFSKGYFSRPVRVEASGIELGGGRVTEILARPLINTFMPELSGFIQPLAGTVAIYREDFMKMKIPVNYGVEIAMLIQAVETTGIWGTAQVNLGNVVHRSKDVLGLGEMAFQILQVLEQMGTIQCKGESDNVMRHVYSAHGHFEIISKRFNTVWREFI